MLQATWSNIRLGCTFESRKDIWSFPTKVLSRWANTVWCNEIPYSFLLQKVQHGRLLIILPSSIFHVLSNLQIDCCPRSISTSVGCYLEIILMTHNALFFFICLSISSNSSFISFLLTCPADHFSTLGRITWWKHLIIRVTRTPNYLRAYRLDTKSSMSKTSERRH